MKSPNKKKLKSGISSTVGGKLGGTSYKTASPYNIKINNMITNNLSPLTQAEGGPQTIAGQYITKTEQGFAYSPGEGMEPIPLNDPDNLLEVSETGIVADNDYQVEEGEEGGLVITGVSEAEEVPGTPTESGGQMPGGVGGGPMEMHSPVKNYKKGYYGIK